MNKNVNCLEGMECPKCGHAGPFKLVVTAQYEVLMSDDGSDGHPTDTYWDNDSSCRCMECDFDGKAGQFQMDTQEFKVAKTQSKLITAMGIAENGLSVLLETSLKDDIDSLVRAHKNQPETAHLVADYDNWGSPDDVPEELADELSKETTGSYQSFSSIDTLRTGLEAATLDKETGELVVRLPLE
ncbi:hypothetical protein [Ferrimonas marina]|nr:hypothetical protein [Ferrimonas marina]